MGGQVAADVYETHVLVFDGSGGGRGGLVVVAMLLLLLLLVMMMMRTMLKSENHQSRFIVMLQGGQ